MQRELVKQSLRLFPIPGYGVLEVGNHRFIVSTRQSERVTALTVGTFVHVIKTVEHGEQIRMALSYDHITTTGSMSSNYCEGWRRWGRLFLDYVNFG